MSMAPMRTSSGDRLWRYLTLETNADHSDMSYPQIAPKGVLGRRLLQDCPGQMISYYRLEATWIGDA
jgi:hypothetical protein